VGVIVVFIADLRAGHERLLVRDKGDEHVGEQHRGNCESMGTVATGWGLAHRCA
jgi:hypothetical protein